jgi:DNA-binding MarR family transcriptional regulator
MGSWNEPSAVGAPEEPDGVGAPEEPDAIEAPYELDAITAPDESRICEIPPGPLAIQVVIAAVSCSSQIVRKLDRALAEEELTWAQWRALRDIDLRRGWTHAAAVARRTGISRQAATALFRRLDERGFLRWMEEDWIKSVRLTPAGQDAVRRGWRSIEHIREAIDRLSLEERRGIVSADESLRRELIRRPARQPWYWEYLPAHLRKEHRPFEW